MRIADALRKAAEKLASMSDTARLDAEVLMADALGVSRSDLLVRHMHEDAPRDFWARIERREGREPVAYITGAQEFFGRPFRVTSDVLIPRADSEAVVEAALEHLRTGDRVIDLGTGSGALLLTLLAERSGTTGIGLDNSENALRIARSNADALKLSDRANFGLWDWTNEEEGKGWALDFEPAELVIANPPYVEESADLSADVRDFEPSSALFAGKEGLDDYRAIIPNLRKLLSKHGVAVLEIGSAQGKSVSEIARNCGFTTEIRTDLANRPRALILK